MARTSFTIRNKLVNPEAAREPDSYTCVLLFQTLNYDAEGFVGVTGYLWVCTTLDEFEQLASERNAAGLV